MHTAVTLGEIAGRLSRLEVRCTRCGRHGRYRTARLIEEYGAGFGLPDLRRRLAADCPKATAREQDRCSLIYPDLVVVRN